MIMLKPFYDKRKDTLNSFVIISNAILELSSYN